MKRAYPVLLTPDESGYVVYVPDFDIYTEGKTLADAMEMARDAIGLMGIDREDDGKALPEASTVAAAQAAAQAAAEKGTLVTLVDVDFAEYRRQNDLRSVKKNCTIPSWLNAEAERAGVNFSAVLQAALKEELHLQHR